MKTTLILLATGLLLSGCSQKTLTPALPTPNPATNEVSAQPPAAMATKVEDNASQDLVADKVLNATSIPDENELKHELSGTWRMAADKSWGATQYHYYPNTNGKYKTFTLTNWSVVQYDADSNVLYSAAGAYSIHGNVYTESIDQATGGMTQFIGAHPQFKILVEGDKYYQLGLGGNPPNIKEMWQRIPQ
jgi:hypothetical protein